MQTKQLSAILFSELAALSKDGAFFVMTVQAPVKVWLDRRELQAILQIQFMRDIYESGRNYR